MGVMPERIGKGWVLQALDSRYANPTDRKNAYKRLTKPEYANKDVADLGAERDQSGKIVFGTDPVKADDMKKHLKKDWFARKKDASDPNQGWWGDRHADLILKHGLKVALKEAGADEENDPNATQKPIKTLWICSGPKNSGPFEVYVYPTEEQVTLIIFSPQIPDLLYEQEDQNASGEDIWIVKRITHPPGSLGEKKLDKYKKGDEILETNLGGNLEIIKRKPKPLA